MAWPAHIRFPRAAGVYCRDSADPRALVSIIRGDNKVIQYVSNNNFSFHNQCLVHDTEFFLLRFEPSDLVVPVTKVIPYIDM